MNRPMFTVGLTFQALYVLFALLSVLKCHSDVITVLAIENRWNSRILFKEKFSTTMRINEFNSLRSNEVII